jgi:hypothetical protein
MLQLNQDVITEETSDDLEEEKISEENLELTEL